LLFCALIAKNKILKNAAEHMTFEKGGAPDLQLDDNLGVKK